MGSPDAKRDWTSAINIVRCLKSINIKTNPGSYILGFTNGSSEN